jgi:hypothetical protein
MKEYQNRKEGSDQSKTETQQGKHQTLQLHVHHLGCGVMI